MPDLLQPQCTKNSAQLYTDIVVSMQQDHAIKWQWHLTIAFKYSNALTFSQSTNSHFKIQEQSSSLHIAWNCRKMVLLDLHRTLPPKLPCCSLND